MIIQAPIRLGTFNIIQPGSYAPSEKAPIRLGVFCCLKDQGAAPTSAGLQHHPGVRKSGHLQDHPTGGVTGQLNDLLPIWEKITCVPV